MGFDFYNSIIEYDLAEKFDIDFLSKFPFLPLRSSGLIIRVAVSVYDETLREVLENTFLAQIEFVYIDNKEKIIFELQYLPLKIELSKSIRILQDNSVESFLNHLFTFCIDENMSDIHLESKTDTFSIRVRHDGLLVKIANFDGAYFGVVSAYLKLIAGLDISLKRLPQDGRFSRVFYQKEYDFRLSSMPTIHGESIVIRILGNEKVLIDIDTLHIESESLRLIKKYIRSSSGLILVTGPTGSGKTTTLYSILNQINDTTKKIITIEEPVEYKINNIQQVNINNEIGLDFTTVLRNILRQDPDVIMIGEIRDAKSLNLALTAALTGHLVFATMHTNNAVLSIDRMLDLGADSFMIASTLKIVVAQRLVRKICPQCKTQGCSQCNMSGFYGREIVTEVLENTKQIANAITKKLSSSQLLSLALSEGFISLHENGKQKVEENWITMDDLLLAIE